jgi:hypothetical protein
MTDRSGRHGSTEATTAATLGLTDAAPIADIHCLMPRSMNDSGGGGGNATLVRLPVIA